MGGAALDGEFPGAAAFPRGDDMPAPFIDGTAFEDEHGAGGTPAGGGSGAREIVPGDFLGGVRGDQPGGVFKTVGAVSRRMERIIRIRAVPPLLSTVPGP